MVNGKQCANAFAAWPVSKIKTINDSSGWVNASRAISVWAVKVFEYLNFSRNNGRGDFPFSGGFPLFGSRQ